MAPTGSPSIRRMRLSPFDTAGMNFWITSGSRDAGRVDLDQGLQIGIVGLQPDHARAGRAVQGFQHHVAVALVEIDQGDRVGTDQGRRWSGRGSG